MTSMNDAAAALGRLLISVIFVIGGFEKLVGFDGTVGYMAKYGLPLPLLAAIVAVVVELGGGILLILGWQIRLVGLVLAVWSIATAVVAHSNFADTDMAIHFMKNLAMAGGLLQLVAFGAGAWSLDARRGAAMPQRA